MQNGNSILKSVRALFEREPRIDLHRWPIRLDLTEDGVVILEGEFGDIAAKKLALEIAGAAPGVRGLIDRLHVAPAEPRGDGAILDGLTARMLDAPDFRNCALRVIKKGQTATVRETELEDPSGDVLLSVTDGVVTLDGWVISLSHKRLAGVLAWWVPGCRDVIDALEVLPGEQDNDDEISDALSLVLEMDPMIPHPEGIRIVTRDAVVTLEGQVGSAAEKSRAEQDAWYLFAVDKVVNRLAVTA